MKYAAVAVALAGAAIADSTLDVKWETWSSTTTPVEETSTATWSAWTSTTTKPVDEASTWTTWDPKPTTTKAEWESWSSSTTSWDPKPTTTTKAEWESWSSSSSTTSSASCSYVTSYTTKECNEKNECWPKKTSSTIYADTCTWSDWSAPATSTTSSKCSYVTEVATKKCDKDNHCWDDKYTTTMYADTCTWAPWSTPAVETKTYEQTWENYPAKPTGDDYNTWENYPAKPTGDDYYTWSAWESTYTVKSTITETSKTWATWETPVVVTSVVTPGWSESGWFGPAWPTHKSGECVQNVVTSYGYPVWKPTPEASKSTETWATWSTSTMVTPTASWSAVPLAPKPKPGKPEMGGEGHAVIAPNGNKWSMTYTPRDDKAVCKTQEVINADIKKIKDLGFTSIRVYGTDCKTLEWVGAACEEYGIKIILGVFIDSTGIKGAGAQVDEIIAWKKWSIVELIVIGNESVFQGFCSAEDLVWFISDCKTKFAAAGYTGSCTTTEPLNIWQASGEKFCKVVDVVAANLYAYFNADCKAENAGTFIQSEIEILEKICVEKDVYVMESGWPSAGECNGAACPGKEEQKVAIKSIEEKCGANVVFFSYEDEMWKQPGQYGVEQHWGCADVFAGQWSPMPTVTATSSATWATWSTSSTPAATTTATAWAKW